MSGDAVSTRKLKCNCNHDWQDKQYGQGLRLFNKTRKGNTTSTVWRCTVCKKEASVNG